MDDQMQTAPQVPSEDQIEESKALDVPPEEPAAKEVTEVPESVATNEANQNAGGVLSPQYDQEIKSEKIETPRKTFFLDLKSNDMGRYVKISERSSGKRSTIIVPEENIQEFVQKIQSLFK